MASAGGHATSFCKVNFPKMPLGLQVFLGTCASLGVCALVAAFVLIRAEASFGWWCLRFGAVTGILNFVPLCVFVVLYAIFVWGALTIRTKKAIPISLCLAWMSGAVAAVILSSVGVRHYESCIREGWRRARGVAHVTSVETQALPGFNRTLWRFHYTYRVGGVERAGTYDIYYDLRKYQGPAIRRLKAKYGERMKDAVLVFYDRNDPKRSALSHWGRVPDGVTTARAVGLTLVVLLTCVIFWQIIGKVDARCAADCGASAAFAAEQIPLQRPYALPVLVALAAYALGAGAYGALFWNCGDPTLGHGAIWFGQYSSGLFGILCATAGSALWPKAIVSFRRGEKKSVDAENRNQCRWAYVALLLIVSLIVVAMLVFVAVCYVLLVGLASVDVMLEQIALFAAIGLSAAFMVGAAGLCLFRFCGDARRELIGRGLTVKRYFVRLFWHMAIVVAVGLFGYLFLNCAFCAKALGPELRHVWSSVLGSES